MLYKGLWRPSSPVQGIWMAQAWWWRSSLGSSRSRGCRTLLWAGGTWSLHMSSPLLMTLCCAACQKPWLCRAALSGWQWRADKGLATAAIGEATSPSLGPWAQVGVGGAPLQPCPHHRPRQGAILQLLGQVWVLALVGVQEWCVGPPLALLHRCRCRSQLLAWRALRLAKQAWCQVLPLVGTHRRPL